MSRFKAVSVDDEPSAHEALRALLKNVSDIELAATWTSPSRALSALGAERPDLLFLDVAMAEMSGLDFLRALADPPVTVLLTAHMEHALSAFELGVRDYLLKPVSAQRLYRCLDHIRPLLLAARTESTVKTPARLSIKCGSAHRLVDPARTLRIEAAGNFSIVYTGDEQVFASEAMKELERRLTPFGFVRIHKSHLVNMRFIRSISATDVRLHDGLLLPTGRAYRAAMTDAVRLGHALSSS
ncbi:LytR/AlgR family response regulator transcription factor [Dokdonella soli]|uniref:LytTR family DNA-binding domain-containing protein n=1 Tax=Dokdonella soli TaxID=529810 RepID=A0ABP3TII5_9GAMM